MQLGVPIDQPLVTVDQPLLVKLDEDLAHRGRETGIHGETLARPIGRGTEPAQLPRDGPARLLFPRPHALDEALAAELVAVGLLELDLALDDHLRRNARMVGPGLPQRIETLHPVIADQNVLQREGERVAHMQAASDVRRRHHHGVGRRSGAGIGGEGAARFPDRVEFRLDLGRSISLVEHCRALIR